MCKADTIKIKVDQEPKTITDQVLTGSTINVPPSIVQPSLASTSSTPILSPKMPEVTKDTPKLTIPYLSRANKQKLREKDDNLALKLVEIFRNLHFELSIADALLHMPKFALMFKSLLNNKEKLFDVLGDPCKFLIPCDFPELDECLALADLVVDYVVDPRVTLILERPFLRTERALIDVYGEELTLRVDDEAITFKVGQTSKYSYNDAESINRIDVIDVAYEEYVQEVLGFSDNSNKKVGEEGTQTYVLFPVLSNGSTNSQNNNKDALVDGKEHDDDIQKSVSPDIHSSSSGAQTRKQGDKTKNKDKGNLVRGLPSKVFENNHTYVACKKGKQHRASCKTKHVSSVSQPLQRTLIEAARTMLADSLLPISFRAEAVNTTCYVQNMSFGSKNPQNTYDDAAFEGKKPEFEGEKPESEVYVSLSISAKINKHDDETKKEAKGKSPVDTPVPAVGKISTNKTNTFSVVGLSNTIVSPIHRKSSYVNTSQYPDDPNMPTLEDITYFDDEEDVGTEADFSNLETTITVSPIPTTRVNNDHHVTQIIGHLSLATQTRSMTRVVKDQEPKKVHQALKDPSWIEAIQEELLQFKMQNVWVLIDLPNEKRAIGHTQEEGIDYEEIFAPVARIEAIRLFLAYVSFMGFMVYQMHVKSAFLYGTIKEEVYACQPLGFEDSDYPNKVYKVFKALYVLHQAPRAWYETLANYLLENDGKSASTPIDTENPLLIDLDGEDVDVHTYRSIISSLMYLTSSRPDIMFAVCACARFQVTPKVLHLHAVKRIFRYLKGKPHLGLWYPKDSPFNLVAYSDSDYAGASLDRKSTTGGCQFLGCRLISWECKKQTVVATSSTEAEYVVAASCCAQVLWIQNQLLDYRMGYEKPSTKLTFYKAFFSSQWKFLIHTILQCMSAKRTSWNEFSSFMASAVICLSTGRKFNFSKYIVDILVRNVDSSSKFYMYPRFLQLMIRAQVGDLSSHTTKYSSPALTQKVFANMRRVGKGFSRVETPLFEGMIVAQQVDDVADEVAAGVNVNDVPVVDGQADGEEEQVESIWVKDIKKGGIIELIDADKDATLEEVEVDKNVEVEENDDELEPSELKELVEVVTTAKLMTEVVTAAATITAATTQVTTATITVASSAARRRKGVVIRDLKETVIPSIIIHTEPKSKDKGKGIMVQEPKPLKKKTQIEQDEAYARELEAELNKNINWDDVIEKVKRKEKENNDVLRYQALKRKPQTESQARKNMMIYLRKMAGFKTDYFKGMSYDDTRPIFKKYFNSNVAFLEKTKEQMEEEDSRALKKKTKSSEEKAAKKQKLDEEVEELRKHLQVVPNNDDDVYTEATPLDLKVLVVDYEIHTENNKPYFKIIRADGTHQLFLSFLSLLRNFDREDLEVLWKLVKERFASSKPKNFSDDFLLTTLTYMFKKPNVEAQVWKSQRGVYGLAKVISWRLLELCGVYITTLTTTQMILLVERRYTLTRFTLDQMLNNVRLEFKEESKVSLELLRFVRQ
nr:uncharacterized mitochondrial protein AtMg00810-like [Tanacetum cinerariifolium]